MRECMNCGSKVTQRFARVFGDNEDEIHGCPECRGLNELCEGAGALPNRVPTK